MTLSSKNDMCKASSKWKWFNNMSEFEFSKLLNQLIENIHRLYMNNKPHEDFVNTSVINDLLHMREYPALSLFT